MSVRLHIDRLVVDAGLAGQVDAPILRDAITTELARLVEAETGWSPADRPAIITRATFAAGPAGALGTQIAGTLHGCLRQQMGDASR